MMLATVRVFLERADGARFRLLGLASAVPEELLARRAAEDDWPARTHLGHALTSDGPLATFVERFLSGEEERDRLFEHLLAERASAIAAAQEQGVEELFERASRERRRLTSALAHVRPSHLEAAITVPGVRDAWGQPVAVSFARYLKTWSQHDLEHEAAIREAITTTPDLSAAALVRRRLR